MGSGLIGQTGRVVVQHADRGHNSDIDCVPVQSQLMEVAIVLVCLWSLNLVQSGSALVSCIY